jgi:hypothetical protein
MMIRRFIAAALVLGFASLLGACSPFSSSMADMWPHWAGGEPAGLPPRPGQPGYAQFIAHGQPNENPPAAAAVPGAFTAPVAQQAPAGTTAAIAEQKSSAPEQKPRAYAEPQGQGRDDAEPLPQPAGQPANDSGAVHGGLY